MSPHPTFIFHAFRSPAFSTTMPTNDRTVQQEIGSPRRAPRLPDLYRASAVLVGHTTMITMKDLKISNGCLSPQ